eukprot:1068884-Rhodomonas_salina.1
MKSARRAQKLVQPGSSIAGLSTQQRVAQRSDPPPCARPPLAFCFSARGTEAPGSSGRVRQYRAIGSRLYGETVPLRWRALWRAARYYRPYSLQSPGTSVRPRSVPGSA